MLRWAFRRSMRRWVWVGAAAVLACSSGQRLPNAPLLAPKAAIHEAAKDPGPVEIELMRAHYELRADGTYTQTFTQRYRILDARGVENWSYTSAGWSPWYMKRPNIDATVTAPDGSVHRLDPATIAEQAAYPEAPDMYGDGRVLRAPLPNVTVGSIIEETIVSGTHQPFFPGGLTRGLLFQSDVAQQKVELIIDAPSDWALTIDIRDATIRRREEVRGGTKRIVIEGGPFEPLESPEDLLPPEAAVWPHVSFSTGQSWRRIASAYSDLVEQKLQGIDFEPTVREATDEKDPPPEKARKLLAWVKGRIRYAAVQFGDAGIVPHAPLQTVTNGYGDCKDQATLLVGLLRAAGFDANVALLRAGTGNDVTPTLPTLDVFDHAIVVVPGEAPLWIDPTADLVRFGDLPVGDQNRLALVVDRDTEGLVRTPVPTPATNTYQERRVVHLADHGAARIEEHSTATGWHDWQLRDTFALPAAKVREFLADYVKRAYIAKDVGNVRQGVADDMTRPFELVVEATKAGVAMTDLFLASTDAGTGPLLDWLPATLTEEDEKERKNDLVMPVPYRAELTWEVHPPKGFVPAAVPNDTTLELGPARLSRSARQRADGVVEVRQAFDVGSARLTPREVEAFRSAMKKWRAEPHTQISFKHRARLLLDEGDLAKGIALLRKEVEAAPKEMLPRLRLARALSDLGFGQLGRSEARAAAALAPGDAFAQRELGDLLSRDDLGRDTGAGFEREPALDAYRAAAKLDDDDILSRLRIGVLLEHDEAGNRYASANLIAACDHYDSLDAERVREFDGGSFVPNVLWCLFHAGRHEELERRIRALPVESVPGLLAVLSAATRGGAATATQEADRLGLSGADRAGALDEAARHLFRRRDYEQARQLLSGAHAEGADAVSANALLRQWQKLKKVDVASVRADSPGNVLLKLIATYMARPKDAPGLTQEIVSARAFAKDAKSRVVDALKNWDISATKSLDTSFELLGDIVVGGFDAKVTGNDRMGYHLRATVDAGANPRTMHAYVIKDRGAYRLRALADDVPELGAEALHAATHGEEDRAKEWLTWATEHWHASSGDDPLREGAFLMLWNGGKGDVKLAAAALTARSLHAADAISVLQHAYAKESDRNRKAALELGLADAFANTERWNDLLSVGEKLLKEYPASDIARHKVLAALRNLERLDQYIAVVRDAMAQSQEKHDEWKPLLAVAYVDKGDFREARKIRLELIAEGKASSGTYNDHAWTGLFVGPTEADVDHALRAVQMRGSNDVASLHTLACLYADIGRLGEAQKTLMALLEHRAKGVPDAVDYYVIGRIAEGLGFRDSARAAYRKLEKPEERAPSATYYLGQRRLERL